MKRYHFPLRPVGVLRAHEEMRAREAFAASVHVYVMSEETLANVRAKKAELEDILAQHLKTNSRASETASFFQAYRQKCTEEITAERATIAAREEMNAKRDLYTAAHRALKGITRLEEKSRSAYRRECDRATQAELDDYAGYRYMRQHATQAR